jgi:hypothetical protein
LKPFCALFAMAVSYRVWIFTSPGRVT